MGNTTLISKNNNLTNFPNVANNNLQNGENQESRYNFYNPKKVYKKKFFSKLNEFSISFNPFLNASSHLFKYVEDIRKNVKDEKEFQIPEIRQELIANIELFEEKALQLGVDNHEVLVARYILCTVIDEFMNDSKIAKNNSMVEESLLMIFHKETYGGENFFYLLERFLKTPAKYIHLLELMYICLSLGFKGKYRLSNNFEMELNNIQDSLFRQIKIVKGKEPDTFYTSHDTSKTKFKLVDNIPYSLIIFSITILLLILYTILTIFLNDNISEFLDLINSKATLLTAQYGGLNETNI